MSFISQMEMGIREDGINFGNGTEMENKSKASWEWDWEWTDRNGRKCECCKPFRHLSNRQSCTTVSVRASRAHINLLPTSLSPFYIWVYNLQCASVTQHYSNSICSMCSAGELAECGVSVNDPHPSTSANFRGKPSTSIRRSPDFLQICVHEQTCPRQIHHGPIA